MTLLKHFGEVCDICNTREDLEMAKELDKIQDSVDALGDHDETYTDHQANLVDKMGELEIAIEEFRNKDGEFTQDDLIHIHRLRKQLDDVNFEIIRTIMNEGF